MAKARRTKGKENAARARAPRLRMEPADAAHWPDLCALFGDKGACGGCWCMTMRLDSRTYEADKGAGNRQRLRRRVAEPPPPGLLGYRGDEVVAWISLGPREEFARLRNSRVLAPVDDQPVWSVVCMVVRKDLRRRGLSRQLLEAAAAFARRHGARILEGYPQDPRKAAMPDVFAWTGLASAFARAGFTEVLRRSPGRPIFRRALRPPPGGLQAGPSGRR